MEERILEKVKEHLNEEEKEYVDNNKKLVEKICNIQRVITMNYLLNLK